MAKMKLLEVFDKVKAGVTVPLGNIDTDDKETQVQELLNRLASEPDLKELSILELEEDQLLRLTKNNDINLSTCAVYTLMSLWYRDFRLAQYV